MDHGLCCRFGYTWMQKSRSVNGAKYFSSIWQCFLNKYFWLVQMYRISFNYVQRDVSAFKVMLELTVQSFWSCYCHMKFVRKQNKSRKLRWTDNTYSQLFISVSILFFCCLDENNFFFVNLFVFGLRGGQYMIFLYSIALGNLYLNALWYVLEYSGHHFIYFKIWLIGWKSHIYFPINFLKNFIIVFQGSKNSFYIFEKFIIVFHGCKIFFWRILSLSFTALKYFFEEFYHCLSRL